MSALGQGQIIRTALEGDIAAGRLNAGDRLDEQALADRFGVSRTPVREALRHLEALGVVQVRPRMGTIVASFTISQIVEMFEVMAELESLCARLAARRMSPQDKEQLLRCHTACGEAAQMGEVNAYYRENVVFHGIIYAGAHNGYLLEQTKRLQSLLAAYRRYQLRLKGRISASYTEHDAIVQAIIDGDAEAASALMHRHVNIQGDAFADLLTTLPSSATTDG